MPSQKLAVLLLCAVLPSISYTDTIKIGGLFLPDAYEEENMFRQAVDKMASSVQMEAVMETVTSHDSLQASQAVCRLMAQGVAAVFMPHSGPTLPHVSSVCESMQVPLVGTGSDDPGFLINLRLPPGALGQLCEDLVAEWQWRDFTLLYERPEDLAHLAPLLQTPGRRFTLRQLDPLGVDHRTVLRATRRSGRLNAVLHCSAEKLPRVLLQAQQVGLLTGDQKFLVTSLDLQTLDLEPFQHADSSIVGLRMVDNLKQKMPRNLTIGAALMHDGVVALAHALQQLDLEFDALDCDADNETGYADFIADFLNTTADAGPGLTGTLQFGEDGYRAGAQVQVVKLLEGGLAPLGTWRQGAGLNLSFPLEPIGETHNDTLRGRHLTVLTVLSAPYCMIKSASLEGNDRYEGFAVELVDKLAKMIGFTYELRLMSHHGLFDPQTNRWTGMMGEMQAKRADMAVADMTITSERYSAVTFTTPFINTGISILYYRPRIHNAFSFLTLFRWQVWLAIAVSYVGVSLAFYVLARLSPFERRSPQDDTEFTLLNSLWFAVGSLRPLGCGVMPRALSMRVLALVWWHFVALLVASYVAGLVALLLSSASKAVDLPFSNVMELHQKTSIKYGGVRGGSTVQFFRDSQDYAYQQMFTAMTTQRGVLTASIAEGVDRVRAERGGYAFLTDSLSIEYAVMCEPDLVQVGGLLDYKGYGIALPLGSRYRKELDGGLLRLKATGELLTMKTRWWLDACGTVPPDIRAEGLQWANVCCAFLMLAVVSVVALAIAYWERMRTSLEDDKSEKNDKMPESSTAL
ncbi:glutamate receptor ionotropic, kainate 2-like [Periplaneta americana]|uniref:glutamate receptor ionotropic, kainate 2-like n=1 Tax=Periplaneta americana TaxID=6978 RepID=UPI0037E85E81